MTFIGKAFVFLNLIVGVGLAVAATTLYTERPAWFEPLPEGGDKTGDRGNPFTFAAMKAETDSLVRAAGAASKLWGDTVREVEERERVRDDRKEKLEKRLERARKGDPGVFVVRRDPATRRVDVESKWDRPQDAVIGPDGQPLKGAELLSPDKDSLIQGLLAQSKALTAETDTLSAEWAAKKAEAYLVEEMRQRQVAIREGVRNELLFLRSFGVNWDEERETVLRRKRQLEARLAGLRPRG